MPVTLEQRRVTDAFYLAFVLWREARAEPREGKIAVVHSILNRVTRPKWWGNDVPSVCIKPWQYSSMTDPKDPQLTRYPNDAAWWECLQITLDVLNGKLPNPVPTADSYYAISMDKAGNPPAWAKAPSVRFVRQVGNHKFYDTDGEHPENVKVAA